MTLPFTEEQFLSAFRSYNLAVQPMQVILNLIGITIAGLLFVDTRWKSRVTSLLLFALWTWTGLVYHILFFSTINPAAKLFGALFIAQGLLLLIFGGLLRKVEFAKISTDWHHIAGLVLIVYALLIYPLLGLLLGHTYPASPTFCLPCPLTIFTIGVLFFTFPTTRWYLVVIPLIWSMIGGSAAFKLGIREDLGLLMSGILSIALFLRRNSAAKMGV